jgi:repressor LexA
MLNDKAREILAFIKKFRRERGLAPSIREIGLHAGITSTNGVRYYLEMLEKAGHIHRSRKISRGIGTQEEGRSPGIPMLGRVAAGQPILAEESHAERLDMNGLFGETENLFALQVRGDSMIDAGIFEGDYVVVRKQDIARPGEIVVALLEDEATVKYYQPRRGRTELVAANENYEPIVVDKHVNFRILGTVRGVVRSVGRI